MEKALNDTKLMDRFTEHDLRAKVACDIELNHAKRLLGHANITTTDRIYRRKPEIVLPAKSES